MAESPQTFGERVRRLREGRGWSQLELAHQTRLSLSSVTRIERGETQRPDIETLERLADAFGVTLDYLRGREQPPSETDEEQLLPHVCPLVR